MSAWKLFKFLSSKHHAKHCFYIWINLIVGYLVTVIIGVSQDEQSFQIKIHGKYPRDECIFDSENWCRYRSTSTKSSSCSILLRLWSAISVLWLIFLPLKMAAISADFFIDMTVCSSLELLLFGVLLLWRLLSDWWCWWCCLPLDSDLLLDDWELPEYIIWNWKKSL